MPNSVGKMFGSINCSKNGMFQSNVSAAMVNVQRLWSFSSFNCCMMNSVMTAWLLLANEAWSGDTQTMLGGGRKAWSKTLQSTTREVSFSFSFPKSLSCDVVLPSPAAAHITQSIWCLRWRIGSWCSLTHYPLTQDNDKAQAATTEMVFVYRECMICVGDRSRYSLFQCWTLCISINSVLFPLSTGADWRSVFSPVDKCIGGGECRGNNFMLH